MPLARAWSLFFFLFELSEPGGWSGHARRDSGNRLEIEAVTPLVTP